MIEFLNKLFGRQPSGATAKERLRLVLMSDHLSLAPEMIDQMKRDLVDVISRYVEVDRAKIDVHFEHQDKALAMLANIPITGVNRNGPGDSGKRDEQPAEAVADASRHAAPATQQEVAEPAPCHPEPVEGRPSEVEASKPKPQHNGNAPRRKRKKSGGGAQPNAAAPAT